MCNQRKFSMRPKHFSCLQNNSMVTFLYSSFGNENLANGTVRKLQIDSCTDTRTDQYCIFHFLQNCPVLTPDLQKIGCAFHCSHLLIILIFWVAQEFDSFKVCQSSLIFSYGFVLQFHKDLFIKNVPPEFQKEKSNGLSIKVCKMYCD